MIPTATKRTTEEKEETKDAFTTQWSIYNAALFAKLVFAKNALS